MSTGIAVLTSEMNFDIQELLTQILRNDYAIMRHLTYNEIPQGKLQEDMNRTYEMLKKRRA